MSEVICVVPITLTTDSVGQAAPLFEPFGPHPSLVRATVTRAASLQLGQVQVFHDAAPSAGALARALDGSGALVTQAEGSLSPLSHAARAVQETGAKAAVLVGPECPFLSPTLAKEQLALLLREGVELVLAPMAARGIAPMVVSADGLARLARGFEAECRRSFDVDLLDFVEDVRSLFAVGDLRCDARFICLPADLRVRTRRIAGELSKYALRDGDESYEPVFDHLARGAWREVTPPRAVRPGPDRPRILMAHYTQRRSPGSTRAFELLLDGWDRAAWDTRVALPGEGDLTSVVAGLGLPTYTGSFRATGGEQGVAQGLRFSLEVEECLKLIEELAPDLVYASGAIPAFAVAARRSRTPSICHLHQPLITANQARSGRACRASGLHNYDHVIATSAWTRQLIQSLFRPDPARLTAIPCGVDLQAFEPGRLERAEARVRLGLPSDGPLVVVAGFLSASKRPELAIDVLPHLPKVTLAFAGSEQGAGYLARLKSLALERRVADRVHFLGFVDMATALAAADLLLHCNPDEPFGLVLVEAMAMRLPIVAPRAAGPSEIVEENETGLLFDEGTPPSRIAELIASLLGDSSRAAGMGERGQRRARERFSKQQFVSSVDRACRRLLDPRTTG